ncbi:hypothetical protein SAMN04487961_3154 [Marinobacter pelagius]|uniref:Uncharacterized protein n=1 Tax=Marinobacter pelagius TaxID=379482 RepID=A0A1I4Z5Z0_9GAMM|nr:hypothetical protein SAMN04487961_3154 [Marinobacter pelagius]
MIKLFSLNHTRIRRFSILAQDKTQFRRVTVLIFRVRNTSASAHTNYLVNFLKSVERLLNQGRVFYIESRPCQPLIFSVFKSLKSAKNRPAYCFKRGAHSTLNRHLVNRFLKKSENHFLQSFQAVTPSGRPCLSGLSLRSGAHSTALRKTVNDQFRFIFPAFGFHLLGCSNATQSGQLITFFSVFWPLSAEPGNASRTNTLLWQAKRPPPTHKSPFR